MSGQSKVSRLTLASHWEEAEFNRGTYGNDAVAGLAAAFEAESMTIRVLPVRYDADDGRERINSLVDDIDIEWRDPTTYVPDVPRQIAFGVLAEYEPVGGSQRAVYTLTADADDALAAAVWLANGSEDPSALHRNIRLHRGDPLSRSQVTVADDDALTALFAEEPDRCIFSGNPTRSHSVTLPYRYAPLLERFRYTDRGLPRVPSTVTGLEGAVSHNEWTANDFEGIDWDTPIQRDEAGTYQLSEPVVEAIDGANAGAFTLHRLGNHP